MALPVVKLHSGTGSDTAASGAGPTTALFGTAAATATSTVVTLLVDNPDLSGVAVDGSAAIWVASSSGIRWSKIASVDNTVGVKTVTVANAFANTESGKNWGIGGKRATLDGSTRLGLDWRAGWTIDIQANDTITANFRLAPGGAANDLWSLIYSSSGTRPLITTSTNSIYGLDTAGAANVIIRHLSFSSTAGTKGNGIGPVGFGNGGATNLTVEDCIIDGFGVGVRDSDTGSNVRTTGLAIIGCEIKNCVHGILTDLNGAIISDCYCHDNSTHGMFLGNGDASHNLSVNKCISSGNASDGIRIACAANFTRQVENCDCNNNGAAGININAAAGTFVVRNNILWNNVRYGSEKSGAVQSGVFDFNAYGGNTISAVSAAALIGAHDVVLTGNPSTSSTDYSLNGTAGAGAACTNTGSAIPNAQI